MTAVGQSYQLAFKLEAWMGIELLVYTEYEGGGEPPFLSSSYGIHFLDKIPSLLYI